MEEDGKMPGRNLRNPLLVAALLAVLLVPVLNGCGQATPEKVIVRETVPVRETVTVKETQEVIVTATPPPPPAKKGGTFIGVLNGDPTSLNGIIGNDGESLEVICLNQSPVTLGGENWGTVTAGDLAESWEVSSDAKEWTFHLRKDVKWQDGQPFTADDVLFTFQAIQDPNVQTGGFQDRFMEEGQPIKFEKVDDYTFKATLKNPSATFATVITVPIIPKHVLEGQDLNTSEFNRQPLGTGPFKVVEWKSGESVTLEPNPYFYRGEPRLDRWVMRILPSYDAHVLALQTGEVDFAAIQGKDVPKFLNDPQFTILTQLADEGATLLFNNAKPIFQDKRVRQALIYALDRKAILDSTRQGYGRVADSPFLPPVFVYEEGSLPQYDYNPEKAKELLGEVGWADSNGDGILEKDGQPFKLSLKTLRPGDLEPLVQSYWKEVGVDVSIETMDIATAVERVYRTTDVDKPYDVLVGGWGLFGSDPDHYAAYYAPVQQGASFFNYYNPEVKALFDKGRVTTDLAERTKIYKEAEAMMWDDLPLIPLDYAMSIYVLNNRVNIAEAEFDVYRTPPFRYPEKIYVPQE
jgi:peptide/nickel transport system substrate-binding protein